MLRLTPLPDGLSLRHPSVLIATWFGAGLLPKVPGTWGALAALAVAWPIQQAVGRWGLLAAAGALFLVGVWAAGRYVRRSGTEDPGPIVVDEVVGQWIALATMVQPHLPGYALAFVLFRAVDILKPWPISWADRNVKGGFGAMFDDALAGAVAAAVLLGIFHFMPEIGR